MKKNYNYPGIVLAASKLLIHLYAIIFQGYGVFRDELYYLACARELAIGYVDQPPLSVWILSLFTSVFGEDWQLIRIIPAIIGAISVYLITRLVRKMGGNNLSAWLAGVAFLMAPINNGFSSVYNMNSIDLMLWILAFGLLLDILNKPALTEKWMVLGIVIGIGMLNKISMAWFAIGLVLFLVISPYRTVFLQRGIYVAGATALLFFMPYVVWNFEHDYAHIEFIRNASEFKYSGISRWDFLSQQVLLEHPHMLVLLLASLAFLASGSVRWRKKSLIIIFLAVQLVLLAKGKVKAEYTAAAYSAVFVTGAIWIGMGIKKQWQKILTYVFLGFYVVSGLVLLPLAVPLLPEESYIKYSYALGLQSKNNEGKEEAKLPQFYADMHGWEDMARRVSEVYAKVPDANKATTVVWASNYGRAGSIDYYRGKYELPRVLSGHNTYYLWGLEEIRNNSFDTFIILGGSKEDHLESLHKVEELERTDCNYCMPYENNVPIFLASEPREGLNLEEVFKAVKNYQ